MNASVQVFSHRIPKQKFEQLCSFWQKSQQTEGAGTLLVTHLDFQANPPEKLFYLLLTQEFAVLLVAIPQGEDGYIVDFSGDISYILRVLQSFSLPWAIITRLDSLSRLAPTPSLLDFVFRFFQLLEPQVFVCESMERALCKQIEQEKLLNQVISQIRQSLELPMVLETAVREARQLLQVDRLVIYQFLQPLPTSNTVFPGKGKIICESLASVNIPSIVNLEAEDSCFSYVPEYREKYRQGTVVAVEDVEDNYSSSFCLAEFLRKNEVRSKLVAPIVVQDELWGLIIAHQCHNRRFWDESERRFLGYIGEHLAIAIYQAELYAQVQQQKNLFEQRVIERTQELYDTLIAAEAASLSKHEFLSNMSHELLTPLTCIIGLSETLQRWSSSQKFLTPEKQQKYLHTIEENGKKLQELINDILDFSQISSGKVILDIQCFSLRSLSHRLIKILQEEVKQKEIILTLDLRLQELEDEFFADQERLQKLLLHLLRNAIKFTPESGRVTLRVWREYNQAIFQVEDTGIGIAEEHIPNLFETFQQLEKSRERTHGGVGLGLALTKQLVELHQGTIEVESSLDEGSLFTIRLPNQAYRKSSLIPAQNAARSSQSQNKTIILISADEEMSNLVCDLLTEGNYQVIWLLDSYLSVQKIEVVEPNLVILDHQLPDIFQISQALKKFPKTKQVKILLFHDTHIILNWKALEIVGLDDYLIKPIQPYLLLEKVRYLLSLN
jgi:two-component system sensor histidine kinase/response regulator